MIEIILQFHVDVASLSRKTSCLGLASLETFLGCGISFYDPHAAVW
jgi:hypothetical protein